MNIRELTYADVDGELWQAGDKYFFIPDEGWWVGLKQRFISRPIGKDEVKNLIKEAIKKNPAVTHFRITEDRTKFEPDEMHKEWSDEYLS